jgi:hypothetical protein
LISLGVWLAQFLAVLGTRIQHSSVTPDGDRTDGFGPIPFGRWHTAQFSRMMTATSLAYVTSAASLAAAYLTWALNGLPNANVAMEATAIPIGRERAVQPCIFMDVTPGLGMECRWTALPNCGWAALG